MIRFILVLIAISMVFASITYLLYLLFRNHKYIKYSPSIIAVAFGSYNLYLAKTVQTGGFEDIARGIMAVMLFVGFSAGIVSGLVIDFVLPRIRNRKQRK